MPPRSPVLLRDQVIDGRVSVCKGTAGPWRGLWVVTYQDETNVQRAISWPTHRSAMAFADAYVRERAS